MRSCAVVAIYCPWAKVSWIGVAPPEDLLWVYLSSPHLTQLKRRKGLNPSPTAPSESVNQFTKLVKMGKHFGELAKIRGIITYRISPFEQKAMAGFISKGVPNTWRRFKENAFRVLPPFIISYIIYDQVEKEHARLQRKNPEDFACDV